MSKQKKQELPPAHTCKVSVPDSTIPYGWRICEEPAITVLEEVRQFKFGHSEQYVKYLCIEHTEEGTMLPPYKEPKARAPKAEVPA